MGLLAADSAAAAKGLSKQRSGGVTAGLVGLLAADSRMIETSPWPRATAAKGLSKVSLRDCGGGQSDG